MAKYRSLIGGAIGDVGFRAGDLIEVPDNKVDEWVAAGLIEAGPKRQPKVVEVFSADGAVCGDRTV